MKKPAWTEGTLLSQQHFQCWDQYLKKQHVDLLHIINSDCWGIHDLKIDEALLKTGLYKIQTCHIFLKNGLNVDYDNRWDEDLLLDLTQQKEEIIKIYLAIPIAEKIYDLSGYPKNVLEKSRWRIKYQSVHDAYDETRLREIGFLCPNLKLLAQNDLSGSCQTIQIDEIHIDSRMGTYYSINFIPPVTNINACKYLSEQLLLILHLIKAKIDEVKIRLELFSQGTSILKNSQWMNFLGLQILQKYLFVLQELVYENAHPKQVFIELLKMLGGLCTYHKANNETDMPTYQHDSLTQCFGMLCRLLSDRLDHFIQIEQLEIKLIKESQALYSVEYHDEYISSALNYYLMIQTYDRDKGWTKTFPSQIKITSRRQIHRVIDSAIPALSVEHIERPPSQLMLKEGVEYFQLITSGTHWQDIVTDKSMMIFLPNSFSSAKLSLIALEENSI